VIDRWVNILFIFTVVVIFIIYGQVDEHMRIVLALVFAILFASIAFIFNWLTLDGTSSSIILGTIAYGIGGLVGALIILAFFISGSILATGKLNAEGILEKSFRRDGSQVWANGFWFALWIVVWYLTQNSAFLIAAVASIAMATADTWATEIGASRLKAKAWLITSREVVKPGTDGGISIYGSLAAFAGALFIALIFGTLQMETSLWALIVIILTGFLGCFIDSYLGARIQGKAITMAAFSFLGMQYFYINNNVINWMATGFASIISLTIILIAGI